MVKHFSGFVSVVRGWWVWGKARDSYSLIQKPFRSFGEYLSFHDPNKHRDRSSFRRMFFPPLTCFQKFEKENRTIICLSKNQLSVLEEICFVLTVEKVLPLRI